MPVILRDGGKGTLRLAVALKGRRHLMITIRAPKAGALEMGIWGRHQGENHYHFWPGPHLPEEFLSPREAAIVRGGMAEIIECCRGVVPDDGFERRLACAASAVLDAAERGDVIEDAPPA